VALTGRNTTGPPWSYNYTGGGMTSSPGLCQWSRLQSNYSPPWSVTDDEDRQRQTLANKTILAPYTICVVGQQ